MAQISSAVAAAVLAATIAVTSDGPASAQLARSQTMIDASTTNDLVTSVRYRGYGGYRYGGGWRGGNGVGVGLCIAAGAIIGGIIAGQGGPYYYCNPGYYPAPGYYAAPGGTVGYCMSRFKSYDPASGTYLGYDGFRHPCP